MNTSNFAGNSFFLILTANPKLLTEMLKNMTYICRDEMLLIVELTDKTCWSGVHRHVPNQNEMFSSYFSPLSDVYASGLFIRCPEKQ